MKKKLPSKKTNKNFSVEAIILMILLAIRFISLIIYGVYDRSSIESVISFCFGIAYFFALTGIFIRKKWGVILVIMLGVIDLLSALTIGGLTGLFAGIIDIALLFLAYRFYNKMSN